jgi:hypothetical protein
VDNGAPGGGLAAVIPGIVPVLVPVLYGTTLLQVVMGYQALVAVQDLASPCCLVWANGPTARVPLQPLPEGRTWNVNPLVFLR